MRSLFSLARTIAPSVLIVDDVDSMLGRRDKTGLYWGVIPSGKLATRTDGYSGSDLHNLCVAAAYTSVRDFLKAETDAKVKGAAGPAELRQLNDFVAAMEQVGASVSKEALHMNELRQWKESFGEGGSRKTIPLLYFL